MNRRQLKAQVRAQRKVLRRQLAEQRAQVRAQLKQARRDRPGRKRRRWWIAVLLVLSLLLLLLRDCSCAEAPEPQATIPPPEVSGEPVVQGPPPQPPIEGQIPRRDRPSYETEAPKKRTWLPAFRLQVAARSPRLAGCFQGQDNPGMLRWTVSVDPESGEVADQDFEPTLGGRELDRTQRKCVASVLADPAYRLEAGQDEPSTPSRVGMVIEF